MANDIDAKIGVDTSAVKSGLSDATRDFTQFTNDVSSQVAGLNATLTSISSTVADVGSAIAKGFTIEKIIERIVEFNEQVNKYVINLKHQADAVGTSVEEFQKYSTAAISAGISTDRAAQTIEQFQLRLGQAQAGSKLLYQAYQTLGVNTLDVAGKHRTWQQVLPEVARSLLAVTDESERQRLSMEILGRGAHGLNEYLKQLAKTDQELKAAVEEVHGVSTETARAMEEMEIKSEKAGITIKNVWATLTTPIKLYVLESIAEWITDIINLADRARLSLGSMLSMLGEITLRALDPGLADRVFGQSKLGVAVSETDRLADATRQLGEMTTQLAATEKNVYGPGSLSETILGVKKKKLEEDIAAKRAEIANIEDRINNPNATETHFKAPPPNAAGSNKPGPGGGHKRSGNDENFLQEWKAQLQQQTEASGEYFKDSKAKELAFWQDKLAWTKANEAEIIAQFIKNGDTKLGAQKKVHDLEVSLETTTYNLRKGLAQQHESEMKTSLSEELAKFKEMLGDKTLTESEWYTKSRELLTAWAEHVKITYGAMSTQYSEALKQINALDREHTKNAEAEWAKVFTFIDSNIQTMVNGILQGTQSIAKTVQSVWQNMATAVIADIAKMMVKYAAFLALQALGAKGLTNPIGGIISSVGSMFGSGGTGGGGGAGAAGSEAKLTTALTKNTTSVAADTLETGKNVVGLAGTATGLLGMIQSAGTWVAQALGLTSATVLQVTSADMIAVTQDLLITALGLNTAAVDANTAVLVAKSAMPFAVGAWEIPSDMPATVHKGEMIIPAVEAEMMRNGKGMNFAGTQASVSSAGGGGGGGGSTHVHIHAVDSRSVQNLLMDNGNGLAQALAMQARNGSRAVVGLASNGIRGRR